MGCRARRPRLRIAICLVCETNGLWERTQRERQSAILSRVCSSRLAKCWADGREAASTRSRGARPPARAGGDEARAQVAARRPGTADEASDARGLSTAL